MCQLNFPRGSFFAILYASNMEFIRDKSSLDCNILFPLLLVAGFAFVLSGEPKELFKAVMTEGAGFTQVLPQLTILLVMSAVFLLVGSLIFRWE